MEKMSAAQIRALIKTNEETFNVASATLQDILNEPEPRRPYYMERLISQLNLCSEIAERRAMLEFELKKALQSGRE